MMPWHKFWLLSTSDFCRCEGGREGEEKRNNPDPLFPPLLRIHILIRKWTKFTSFPCLPHDISKTSLLDGLSLISKTRTNEWVQSALPVWESSGVGFTFVLDLSICGKCTRLSVETLQGVCFFEQAKFSEGWLKLTEQAVFLSVTWQANSRKNWKRQQKESKSDENLLWECMVLRVVRDVFAKATRVCQPRKQSCFLSLVWLGGHWWATQQWSPPRWDFWWSFAFCWAVWAKHYNQSGGSGEGS